MSISEISIRRPVFAWMLMFGLIIFGAIAFERMGISQLPDVDFPVVNIGLELDNAAPELLETNVVDVIEDAVMGIEGLSSVTSSVSQTYANITCQFVLDHDVNIALQEVQNRIQQSQNLLPTALYPPVLSKINPVDQPILTVMVTADDTIPLYQLMMYARNTLKDQLSTVRSVGNVTLSGYVDPNLRVWVDTKKLYSYQLTGTDISTAIQNEQIEQPAGRIEAPLNEMNIRVLGEEDTSKAFSRLRINTRGGTPNYRPIVLGDVARVEPGVSDLRAISRYNGKTAVGLGIVKQHGANAVEVSRLIHEKVAQMNKSLLPGYHMDIRLDTTQFIRDSVHELDFTLVLAAILTSAVCYLFLGSWSSTLNVFMAIPTSVIGTFTVLYFFGFTLNTFTLLGLSLAIGIVVDDAIMMLENIVRHYEMGKTRLEASLDGSREISFAAIAATLAIAAIFIPVIFMQGVVGRYFYQYGITVTVAVFLSLLEALTLAPMRTSRFLRSANRENPGRILRMMDALMSGLSRSYKRSLGWILSHRLLILLVSLLIFSTSIFFVKSLRKELIPEQDQSLFLLTIQAPVSSSIQATDKIYQTAETYLKKQPEIQDLYTTIGNYQGNNVVNEGVVYVTLKDPKTRKTTQRQVMDRVKADLKKLLPGDLLFTQDLSLAGFSASRGYPIQFTVNGPDWDKTRDLSQAMATKLSATGLVEDLNSDFQEGMPQINVKPDRDRAAAQAVSVSSIGQEVAVLTGGMKFTSNTEFPIRGHRYYIRVRSDPDQHASPSDIPGLMLRNNRGNNGELIPVSKVADTLVSTGPEIISRADRSRAATIFANVTAGKSQQDALQAVQDIGKQVLPPGYLLTLGGSAQAFQESFDSLVFALLLGIVVSYMVLASQFNSFVHPISVLMALPFSLSGALAALYFAGQSLSLFSMIGLILLMGIVKKNSILLVDFTNQRRAEGLDPRQALLEACPVRLRPILMTSIATVAGAIPAAFNFGPGAETRIPMAISIIGGVTVSTLLTLFVVPCVYSLLSRVEYKRAPEAQQPRKAAA